ncbi:MAG: hypothetical protein AAF587_36220 [Bacteroidota bacterium]
MRLLEVKRPSSAGQVERDRRSGHPVPSCCLWTPADRRLLAMTVREGASIRQAQQGGKDPAVLIDSCACLWHKRLREDKAAGNACPHSFGKLKRLFNPTIDETNLYYHQ